MTPDRDALEQRYRNWLRWYPRWFRRDHAEEVLAVLLDGAPPEQHRPGPAECLDLARGGLVMRLRPRIPRSDRTTRAALWFMYASAAVGLVVLTTLLVTLDEVRTTILARDPGFSRAEWRGLVAATFRPMAVALALSALVWSSLAWVRGRGHRWASLAVAGIFVENTGSLLHGLAHGSATYTPKVLLAGGVLWSLEAVAVVLLTVGESRRRSGGRRRRPAAAPTGRESGVSTSIVR